MTQQYPPQPPPYGQPDPRQWQQVPQQPYQATSPPVQIPAPKTSFWRSKKGALVLLAVGLFGACGVANNGTSAPKTPTAPTWSSAAAQPAQQPAAQPLQEP